MVIPIHSVQCSRAQQGRGLQNLICLKMRKNVRNEDNEDMKDSLRLTVEEIKIVMFGEASTAVLGQMLTDEHGGNNIDSTAWT